MLEISVAVNACWARSIPMAALVIDTAPSHPSARKIFIGAVLPADALPALDAKMSDSPSDEMHPLVLRAGVGVTGIG